MADAKNLPQYMLNSLNSIAYARCQSWEKDIEIKNGRKVGRACASPETKISDKIFVNVQAARASRVLKEPKDKLEKRMEELTLRLQLKKRLRINILDCSHLITELEESKEQETAKLQDMISLNKRYQKVFDPMMSFITKHVSIACPATTDCTLPLPSKYVGMGSMLLWIGIGGSIFFGVLERAKLLLAQRGPDPRMVTRQVTWCTSTKDTMESWTNIDIP
ncbi:hypothetical protein Tco_0808933 [Tanacetum coccineum]